MKLLIKMREASNRSENKSFDMNDPNINKGRYI